MGVFSRPPSACWGPIGCSSELGSTHGCAHAPRVCLGFRRSSHRECQGNGRRHDRSRSGNRVLARHSQARKSGPGASEERPEVHSEPRQPPGSSRGAWGHTPLVAVVVREGHAGSAAWTRRYSTVLVMSQRDRGGHVGRASVPQPPGRVLWRTSRPAECTMGRTPVTLMPQTQPSDTRGNGTQNVRVQTQAEPKRWRLPGVS